MQAKDYIANRIKKETEVVFGVTGSAIMNLFDSLHKEGFKIINNHHEQASAMAADAYARVSEKLGVCVVTSGPGATNLITGTCGSWYDSVPVLNIAGQVPTGKLKTNYSDLRLRQRGFQETDTTALFKSITKMSKMVQDVEKDLEEAITKAKEDRKGPVFLDLCDDIQRKEIEGRGYFTSKKPEEKKDLKIKEILGEIYQAKRPIIVLGAGAKSDNKTKEQIVGLVNKLEIPTLLTWGGMEILDDKNPFNCRDFGTISQRIGNYALKNADLVLCLGARLNPSSVGGSLNEWSRARLIMVDIDKYELKKQKTHISVLSDIYSFAKELSSHAEKKDWSSWLGRIQNLRKEHPLPDTFPYKVIRKISEHSSEGDIIIPDTGNTLTWTYQAWKVKKNQILFSSLNHSPMGYALPASIGAQLASLESRVISISGDGGFQMNLQELQTILGNNLPIKIFVFNNKGYGAIKQNQNDWKQFLNYGVACEPYMAGLEKICQGFENIKYVKIATEDDLEKIKDVLNYPSAIVCEVQIKEGTKVQPKLKAGDAFDDLYPKLNEEDKKRIDETLRG